MQLMVFTAELMHYQKQLGRANKWHFDYYSIELRFYSSRDSFYYLFFFFVLLKTLALNSHTKEKDKYEEKEKKYFLAFESR
jgi:hypothetical protein